jgi:hypothetical protein
MAANNASGHSNVRQITWKAKSKMSKEDEIGVRKANQQGKNVYHRDVANGTERQSVLSKF